MNKINKTYWTNRTNRSNRSYKTYLLIVLLTTLVSGTAIYKLAKGDTNIDSTNRYAWSDISGWWDHYVTNTVNVTSYKLEGYASSSIGEISLDCATSPIGNICGTSEYGVCNGTQYAHSGGTCQGSESTIGNLSGFAWNDSIGWISFCGGNSTTQCPGTIAYGVTLDANGDFHGWAWNDIEGWISFNSADYGGSYPYKVATAWRATSTIGYLESSIFDQQTQGALNSIIWQGTQPTNTCVKFQIAVSDSPSGPWTYHGTGQETSTYFGSSCPGPDTPIKISGTDRSWVNNKRYLRYKVRLDSNLFQDQTPTVNNIILNWSP